jgi:hypothetical protein
MSHNHTQPLLLAALLALIPAELASAQDAVRNELLPLAIPTGEVLCDQPGDGRIWALGRTYKASFGIEGATYIPAFGSQAPHNFPLRFELTGLEIGGEPLTFAQGAQPVREGSRIAFQRGPVEERYDLALEHMEQSFVIDTQGLAGDLVVRMLVDTELLGQADELGLVFHNEFGHVSYSQAFVVEDSGERIPVTTMLDGALIEIRVPAETVAAADGKLVIDPLVSTNTITVQTVEDEIHPDVAAGLPGLNCIAIERVFSAADHDIWNYMVDDSNVVVAVRALDITSANWTFPAIAFNRSALRWMTVAEVQLPSGKYEIFGRQLGQDQNLGPVLALTPSAGDFRKPALGGDLNSGTGTKFLMVCEFACATCANPQCSLRGVFVSDAGVISAPFLAACCATCPTGALKRPALSKTNGRGVESERLWGLAYERASSVFLGDADLFFRRISYSGESGEAVLELDTTTAYTSSPAVSSPAGEGSSRVLVTYTSAPTFTGVSSIQAKLVEMGDLCCPATMQVLDSQPVRALFASPTNEREFASCVDSDGRSFMLGWSENSAIAGSNNNYNVMAQLNMVAERLMPAGSLLTQISAGSLDNAAISADTKIGLPDGLAPSARYSMILELDTGAGRISLLANQIAATPFTLFCNPGTNGAILCPCGNAPSAPNRGCNNSSSTGGASINATGNPDEDTVTLQGQLMRSNATAIFLQGTINLPSGVVFGDGVRCVGGQILRLAVKTTNGIGAASYPAVGEDSIRLRSNALGAPIPAGSVRGYQIYYRDPLTMGCPTTFNITNALSTQW